MKIRVLFMHYMRLSAVSYEWDVCNVFRKESTSLLCKYFTIRISHVTFLLDVYLAGYNQQCL